MNIKPLAVAGALFFITACGNKNEIALYNGYKFNTPITETVTNIDSAAKLPYIEHFNNIADIQIPLYRILSNKNYTIYLGFPFHTTLSRIAAAKKAQTNADTIWALKESPEYFYKQYKKGNLYLTEYVRNVDSSSMVCVFGVTTNQQIADSLMNESKLNARITK